jgi:general stress protein 26
MEQKIIDFLNKNKLCVLTTLLEGGKPHSATMHFASRNEPLEFVFFTKTDSRKCTNLEVGKKYPASLVVGFSEEEWKELQLEGEIEKIKREESEADIQTFADKFTGATLKDDHVVLRFTPNWWRYTEFKTDPPTIITSE